MLGMIYGTPVIREGSIYVKRDDLAGNSPHAPPLGKLRGIATQVLGTDKPVIGVVDRSPGSRNSWAVAYCCNRLKRRCIAYGREIGPYQREAQELGAEYRVVSCPPEASPEQVYDWACNSFDSTVAEYGYMPPDDCYAPELIDDARAEVRRTGYRDMKCDTLVIPTGSGGLATGIIKGLDELELRPRRIVLHLGGSRRAPEYVKGQLRMRLSTETWERYETSLDVIKPASVSPMTHTAPFPANPTYELPAWNWLLENPPESGKTLFWNAGG